MVFGRVAGYWTVGGYGAIIMQARAWMRQPPAKIKHTARGGRGGDGGARAWMRKPRTMMMKQTKKMEAMPGEPQSFQSIHAPSFCAGGRRCRGGRGGRKRGKRGRDRDRGSQTEQEEKSEGMSW